MNTEIFNDINWLAVFCGALAYFFLGAIWYSKMLFATAWIAHTKINMDDPNVKKGVGGIMLISFIWMFITALGIAMLRARIDSYGWMTGVKLGAITAVCFGIAAISISYVYEKRPLGLYFINGGYTLLGNILAGIIICCWE